MTDPTPTTSTRDDLAAMVTQLGGVLLAAETVDSVLALVARLAAEAVAGTVGAGAAVVDVRGRQSTAATGAPVEQADQLQHHLDAGPCLTAWRDQTPVQVDDVSSETRWPDWTAAVALLDVRSALSVPLTTADVQVGAITVYSCQPHAYDDRSAHLLGLFAQQAAVLLSNAVTLADARQTAADLAVALDHRDVIGQAKGVLISQGAAAPDRAFAMLVSASQRSNRKLYDVARRLVADVVRRNASPPRLTGIDGRPGLAGATGSIGGCCGGLHRGSSCA